MFTTKGDKNYNLFYKKNKFVFDSYGKFKKSMIVKKILILIF